MSRGAEGKRAVGRAVGLASAAAWLRQGVRRGGRGSERGTARSGGGKKGLLSAGPEREIEGLRPPLRRSVRLSA